MDTALYVHLSGRMEARFDSMESRFDLMIGKIGEIDSRLAALEDRNHR